MVQREMTLARLQWMSFHATAISPAMKFVLSCLLLGSAVGAHAQTGVPHLNHQGQAGYADYLAAQDHRAFAIAPGGSWGWRGNAASPEAAEAAALATCQSNTRQKCVPYSLDGKPVFDAKAWPHLWGPYASDEQAKHAPVGTQLGARFPNLAYADAKGGRLSLSELRGKVVVLHLWGSWCGPCRREMPDLQKLYEGLKGRKDIVFVPMQVREDFSTARRWTEQQGIKLPLFDSGSQGKHDTSFRLDGGKRIADRDIAMVFPSTYVLDKRGMVVFSQFGPAPEWGQYRDFLLDTADRSGR